jgi:NitT/TauT family transport system ATP-binding protein
MAVLSMPVQAHLNEQAAAAPMLSFSGVGKTWDSFVALQDISLDVQAGEFISLIGPSGCGKSTLLDMAAGLTEVSSGTVKLNGTPITGPSTDVGFVFQQDATFPWLTAKRNIEFGLEHLPMTRSERSDRALEMLALVGLADFKDHYPHQLSGGMRQRVNIARVLAVRPKIVLMDEPFGALDEQTRLRLGDEVLHIWRETNATCVFVTHSLSEAAVLSDRIVIMGVKPGRIIEIVDSPFGKDRSSAIMGDPQYAQLTGHLWRNLNH